MERSTIVSGKGEIIRTAFSAMERANAKMDDMLSNMSIPTGRCNLFIVGNWKKPTNSQQENGMIFLCGRRKS